MLALTSFYFLILDCKRYLEVISADLSTHCARNKEQDANSGRAQRAASSPDNVLSQEAAIAKLPCPQLDSHNGKDDDDEDVEEENI